MYSRDYLVDFIDLIKKDSTDDALKNIFTEEYPFKLQMVNVIIFLVVLCSGYILQKLVVNPYITSPSERESFQKEIIGKDIKLILLHCIFIFIFGNYTNTFSINKGTNLLLFILMFYGGTFAFQKFKSISEIDSLTNGIEDVIMGKKKVNSLDSFKKNWVPIVGLTILSLICLMVLIYGIVHAYESGIVLYYIIFTLVMFALVVFVPLIYNGNFKLSSLLRNFSLLGLLLCRFDNKINAILSGLLSSILINEISWQKK
jgi:hypothetical protein